MKPIFSYDDFEITKKIQKYNKISKNYEILKNTPSARYAFGENTPSAGYAFGDSIGS